MPLDERCRQRGCASDPTPDRPFDADVIMNPFFGNQLSPEELQRQQLQQKQQAQAHAQSQRQQNAPRQLSMAEGLPTSQAFQPSADPMSAVSDTSMFDGDSLDDIIRDNSHEMIRRQSITQQPGFPGAFARSDSDTNMGMMDFSTPTGDFRNFTFTSMDATATSPTGVNFPNITGPMAGQPAAFGPAGQAGSGQEDYSGMSNMMGDMIDFSNLSMGPLTSAPTQMGIFTTPANPMDSMSPTFAVDPSMDAMPQMEGGGDSLMSVAPDLSPARGVSAQKPPQQQSMGLSPFPQNMPTLSRGSSSTTSYHSPAPGPQTI